MTVFLDTNIPMYAAGRRHRYRSSCQRILRAVAQSALAAATDVEVFQEIVYRYQHIGAADAGWEIFDHFLTLMRGWVLPVGEGTLELYRELGTEHRDMRARDLVHLAVMRQHGIDEIVSTDRDFDRVTWVRRLDPPALARRL